MCKSCNKELNISSLSNLTIEQILEMYREGYRIKELNVESLATCPSSIQQGTSKTVTITPSGGTPPYTKLEFLVNGNVVRTLTGSFTTPQQIAYNFPESSGIQHTYGSRVTDSCLTPTSQIFTETPCSVNITSGTVNNYGCVNGICTPGAGTLPAGCDNTCTTPIPSGCDPVTCPTDKNYCVSGQCIPKTYAYAGIGFFALMMLSR